MPEKQPGSQTVSGIAKAVCHAHMAHKFRKCESHYKTVNRVQYAPWSHNMVISTLICLLNLCYEDKNMKIQPVCPLLLR